MSTGRPPGVHRASTGRRLTAPHSAPKNYVFWTYMFIDFFPISAPILPPFWSAVHDFGTPFSSIDLALIVHWLLIDFWYPWSCEKTTLTLYSSQKTRNHRFGNVIDLSLSFDIVVASLWDHFLISFHKFSIPICALIFGCPFMEIGSQKGPAREPGHRQKLILFTTFSEHRSLDAFWSTFGTHWAPFSLPSVRFWLHFGRFG